MKWQVLLICLACIAMALVIWAQGWEIGELKAANQRLEDKFHNLSSLLQDEYGELNSRVMTLEGYPDVE